MTVLSLTEVADLKQKLRDAFGVELHFHDACGGQHFSVEQSSEELRAFIAQYFSEKQLKVDFYNGGRGFGVYKG